MLLGSWSKYARASGSNFFRSTSSPQEQYVQNLRNHTLHRRKILVKYRRKGRERLKKMLCCTTARLTLRPLKAEDYTDVCRYAQDGENTRYMIFYPHQSNEQTRRFLEEAVSEWEKDEPAYYEFALECGGEVIGGISLYVDENRKSGELGWILRKDRQGCGYVFEAVQGLLHHVYELEPELRQLRAECDSRNLPSRRLAERLGMTLADAGSRRTYPQTGEEAPQMIYTLLLQ